MAGGGGGSSSSSSTTVNTDQRLAVGDGGAGISGDNSSINITSVDGAIVSRALDSVDSASAVQGDIFSKLLDVSKDLIGTTQKSVENAYSRAATDAKGSLDNKTIVILGLGAAAAWAFTRGR